MMPNEYEGATREIHLFRAVELLWRAANHLDLAGLKSDSLKAHGLRLATHQHILAALGDEPERCPIIIGGERCGKEVGHAGKCVWLRGD